MPLSQLESVINKHVPAKVRKSGSIPVEQLPQILRKSLKALSAGQTSMINELHAQIDEMSRFISSAYSEIATLRPHNLREVEIPDATDELHAVVSATEEATNIILDTAEKLGTLSKNLPDQQAQEWQSLVVKIYEASNFQDVTGQRIEKVVATLRGIETRVSKLVTLFPHPDVETDDNESSYEQSLLNGPLMPDAAIDQNDIDAMFNCD